MATMRNNDCAIIIGINNYTNYYSNIISLGHAVNDAYEIRKFLEEEIGVRHIYYFTDDCPEFQKEESILIKEQQIIRTLIRPSYVNLSCFFQNELKDSHSDSRGKIWFFFSGHGQNINGKQYLMTSDSKHNDSTYAIDVNFIAGKLRNSGASDVIMFVDACRTRLISKGQNIEPKIQKGIVIFWSCSLNQRSFEDPGINHGVFTKVLLDGLRKCATVEKLDEYLQTHVNNWLKILKISSEQTPCLSVEPRIKQKLILQEEIASQEEIDEYPIQIISKHSLIINKIFLFINNQREKYKVKFSISYLAIGCTVFILCLFFSYLSTSESVTRLMIGGENIPWRNTNSKSPNVLNSKFKWFSGTDKKNSFQILSENTVRINGSPGTEYWRNVLKTDNLPPTISFPIDRDFEATVKVTLNSTITFQRAYFGVRDSEKKHRQILIYLLENSKVEAAYVDEDVPAGIGRDNTYMLVEKPLDLKISSDTAYLKIRKYQNSFQLSYSETGRRDWIPISNLSNKALPHEYGKCELFFSVISNNENKSAVGDFSNLSITYLQ
jgi:Caspase domain